MRRALIVGHEGQDGRLMSAHLRAQGYEVAGWGRRGCEGLVGMAGDGLSIGDPQAVAAVLQHWRPDEVYYFAAHHHSSEQLQHDTVDLFRQSVEVNLMSLVHFLQAVSDHLPTTRLFYAVSSRIFGTPAAGVASEATPLDPQCPYGITKVAGLQACRYYRQRHSLHISVGIMFNHESALRPEHYLSHKIIQGALAIRKGEKSELWLGCLTSGADWSYAPDTVQKIHRMVQLPAGEEFVIATGVAHTVGQFAETAFALVGLNWSDHVRTKADIIRQPRPPLVGDDTRFRQACGWTEERSFRDLIRQLIIDAGGAEFLV